MYYILTFGNQKHVKIWLAYFLAISHFPLHALPVWGVGITASELQLDTVAK
jgi:hypothetical protein